MLRVVYSNAPEALLAVLAQQLEKSIGLPARDPFARTELIVASRPLGTWVARHLAARAGIISNFETLMLRRFVSLLVQRAFPGARALDGDVLRDLILSRFLDQRDLEDGELSHVHHYLSAGATDPNATELRRIQLATQIGYLFEEYTLSRRDMLHTWATAAPTSEDLRDPLASWQRRLWRDIAGSGGELERLQKEQDTEYIPLPRLLEVEPTKLVSSDTPLFVFGLSFVGTLFHELLAHVAKAVDVHLYALNPCMEFWEDLPSVRDRRPDLPKKSQRLRPEALEGEDPFGLRAGNDCRALTLWGRPGRESVRLLNEATSGRSEGLYVDPSAARPTLLTQLQRDILSREPSRTAPPEGLNFDGDSSIEILDAPSVRRECEGVAARIWALLHQEPNLRLDEISVLIAGREPEAYVAPLLAAFRENHGLPAQLVGLSSSVANPMGEAAALLLDLPLSRFTRADVLRVITHPAVLARHPDVDAQRWIEWIDALGIFHGADRSDHHGTYIDRDVVNWDQGLRRLALGAFLTSQHDGTATALSLRGEHYVPHPAGRHLDQGAGELLMLARSLIADARALSKAHLPASKWGPLLSSFLQTYVVPRDEYEQKALNACLRAVRALGERELGERPLSFLLAKELVKDALTQAAAAMGSGEPGGVRIATVSGLRGVPAKITFVVGLSEGSFPSSDRGNPLDLRPRKPRAGDASSREKDEYLFLEAMLCTRERFICTYVGREEKSGEEKHPSPVIVELLRMLRAGYGEPVVRKLPLWRADTDPDSELLPSRAASEERNLRLVGQALSHKTGPLPRDLEARALVDQLPSSLKVELEASLRISPPPVPPEKKDEDVWRVSLSALRRYLESPLFGSARVRLRLYEDQDEDLLEQVDEPFGSSKLLRVSMLRGAFLDGWRAAGGKKLPKAWNEAWDGRAEQLIGEGALPVGVFLEVERKLALQALETWSELLAPQLGQENLRVLRFGPAEEHEVIEQTAPPLLVHFKVPGSPNRTARVEVVGATQPMLGTNRSVLLLQRSGTKPDPVRENRELLKPFLDRVVLVAAGLAPEEEHHVSLVYEDVLTPKVMTPVTSLEARGWLETVLSDLLYADNGILMPIEGVLSSDLCGETRPFSQAMEALLRSDRDRDRILSGPVRHAEKYPIPGDEEAAELFARRLELFARRFGLALPPATEEAPPPKKKPAARKGAAR